MDLSNLTALVALIAALSVASERLVEILKGVIPWLNGKHADPVREKIRVVLVHVLTVAVAMLTAALTLPAIRAVITTQSPDVLLVMAFGMLASGGSSFWNSILGWTLELKKIRQSQAEFEVQRARLATRIADAPAAQLMTEQSLQEAAASMLGAGVTVGAVR